jgi:hypothetical protein
MSSRRQAVCAVLVVGFAFIDAFTGCTPASPTPNVIHSVTRSVSAPSGCTSPDLELVVPGAGTTKLQTCTDGRITNYNVAVTVHRGTVLEVHANPSEPSKTVASLNYDGHGGLLTDRNVASTRWDEQTYHDTITALNRGRTDVRGYGPTYCLSYRSTATPNPEPTDSTTPRCHLFTLDVTD